MATRDWTFSKEERKQFENEFAANHPDFHSYASSMCIFKRKRSLRCCNGEEKRYRVKLDLISLTDNKTGYHKVYWSVEYFINDEPFDNAKHTTRELMMMYDWVEERKARFESYGHEIVLWRY